MKSDFMNSETEFKLEILLTKKKRIFISLDKLAEYKHVRRSISEHIDQIGKLFLETCKK